MANDDFDLPRPTDAVPSSTSSVINDDAKVLDYVVNSTGTVTTRTGKQIMTIDQAIQSAAPVPLNGGVWASGQTFEFYNQYMYYDGIAYSPLPATTLPYTVGATPDLGLVYQIKLNDHAWLSGRNPANGTAHNANDVGRGLSTVDDDMTAIEVAAEALAATVTGNTGDIGAINSSISDLSLLEPRILVNESEIAALQSGQGSGVFGYATLADANADLTPPDKAIAYVTNDPAPTNNGTYRKDGATGTGSWVQSNQDLSSLAYKESLNASRKVDSSNVAWNLSNQSIQVSSVTTSGGLFTRFNNETVVGGVVDRVDLNIAQAGDFEISALELVSGNDYKRVKILGVATLSEGLNTVFGSELDDASVSDGQFIAVRAISGGLYTTPNVLGSFSGSTHTGNNTLTYTQLGYDVAINVITRPNIADIQSDISGLKALNPEFVGESTLLSNTASNLNIRCCSVAATDSGAVESVTVGVGTAGDGSGMVVHLREFGASKYAVVENIEVFGLTAGLQDILLDVPFIMESGDLVGFTSATGGAQVKFESGGSSVSISTSIPFGILSSSLSSNTFNVGFEFINAGTNKYSELVAKKKSINRSIIECDFSKQNRFDDIQTATANWSRIADGVQISTTSDQWNELYRSVKTNHLDSFSSTALIRADVGGSVFGLGFTGDSVSGMIMQIDGVSNLLTVYHEYSSGSPVNPSSVPLGFTVDAGTDYFIEIIKSFDRDTFPSESQTKITVKCTDMSKMVTAVHSRYYPSVGMCWGRFGAQFSSGGITLKKLNLNTGMPKSPRLAVIGDSITEGNTIYENRDARWPALFRDYTGGDCFISGQGGATTSGAIDRWHNNLRYISPDYIIFALGTNDSVALLYNDWVSNIEALMGIFEDLGTTPIMTTLPPRPLSQSNINLMNAYVRNSGRPYIDFAKCLSVNGDDATWKPEFNFGDNTHPNVAGHAAMFKQLLVDAPFLTAGY